MEDRDPVVTEVLERGWRVLRAWKARRDKPPMLVMSHTQVGAMKMALGAQGAYAFVARSGESRLWDIPVLEVGDAWVAPSPILREVDLRHPGE